MSHDIRDPERRCVDVMIRGTHRPRPLTYAVPDGTHVQPGSAVLVPYGAATREGIVIGTAVDPSMATRPINCCLGQAVSPQDLQAWHGLAAHHAMNWHAGIERMLPSGLQETPLDSGPLVPGNFGIAEPNTRNFRKRLYIHPPLVRTAPLAAYEATRLAALGQVLILCPSTHMVEELSRLLSAGGSARLDSRARRGAVAGFVAGTVRIGIGTRAHAWLTGPDLAAILVPDEGHPGHRDMRAPYATSLEIAAARAVVQRVCVTATSLNPSASSLGTGLKAIRIGRTSDWPRVTIVNTSRLPPGERAVPAAVGRAIEKARTAGMECVALAERAPARRLCETCKARVPCQQCDAPRCAHPAPACPQCGSTASFLAGLDAVRVDAMLGIPGQTHAALDALPCGSRLVVAMGIDRYLSTPGLDPEHRAMKAVLSAAQAAGKGGHLVVVTQDPNSRVMAALSTRDQYAFAQGTWERARVEGLPPFGHVVIVRSKKRVNTKNWPGTIWGPKAKGGEYELLVHASAEELAGLRPMLRKLRERGQAQIRIT